MILGVSGNDTPHLLCGVAFHTYQASEDSEGK
jgi:hypothetical protein